MTLFSSVKKKKIDSKEPAVTNEENNKKQKLEAPLVTSTIPVSASATAPSKSATPSGGLLGGLVDYGSDSD